MHQKERKPHHTKCLIFLFTIRPERKTGIKDEQGFPMTLLGRALASLALVAFCAVCCLGKE